MTRIEYYPPDWSDPAKRNRVWFIMGPVLKRAKATEGKPKLSLDGHHTGVAGEYLGARVFFEVLFGESCVGSTFVPPGISSTQARFLQETPPLTRRW